MELFSRATAFHRNLRQRAAATAKKFFTCPKCGYNAGGSTRPTSLPAGINASVLLDTSPTPQLLLSESNVIIYANKSACRILRVAIGSFVPPEEARTTLGEPVQPVSRAQTGLFPEQKKASMYSQPDESDTKNPAAQGLLGLSLDQLNVDLSDKDMRRWISLAQVFENIKVELRKREARAAGHHAEEAEIYGEGPKYSNYDYYGDLEREQKRQGADPDHTIRDTVEVLIDSEEGASAHATMYVALVDPYSTGYSYSSVSFIPVRSQEGDAVLEDATFGPQLAVETTPQRRRKRDRLMGKKPGGPSGTNRRKIADTSKKVDEYATGKSGEDLLARCARIKDLILDEMDYCFIALSPDGDIVITNRATKAVLGQETLKASMGEGFEWIARLDIWRPDFSERLPFEEWALNKLITHRKPLTQVIGLYAGDFPLVVELRGKCIWENEAKEEGLLAALAVVVDQTAWFTKEKNMQTTQLKQGMFLQNISKELKTPVAGIVGLLEEMYGTGEGLSQDQRNYLQQIFGSVNNLLLVINDIIDFNKIEGGDVSIDRNTFVLQDLVNELQVIFSGSMSNKEVQFEVDTSKIDKSVFGDGTRLLLYGDDAKIRRIAINLLSNAFKFTTSGTVTLTVSTESVQRNSLIVRFEIKDTGTGLTEESRKLLFVPLDKMNPEDTKALTEGRRGGTGVGLGICQKFTSMLGGTIGCDSVLEEGSTFWFSVPCGRPSPDSKPVIPPKQDTLSSTMGLVIRSEDLQLDPDAPPIEAKPQAKVVIEGTIVMLVEDNWAHQVVMEKRLSRLGCQVLRAVNGQNCIQLLKKEDADVDMIFMDLQMPLMNGFEATELIRKDPALAKWKTLPIIGVTATDTPTDRERAKECGINEFTVKPLSEAVVSDIIERSMDPISLAMRSRTGGGEV